MGTHDVHRSWLVRAPADGLVMKEHWELLRDAIVLGFLGSVMLAGLGIDWLRERKTKK